MSSFIEYEWDALVLKWNEQDDNFELSEQYLELERFRSAINLGLNLYKEFSDPDYYEIHGA